MSGQATFQEVVQSDPDICNNCFRRTHDRYERNYKLVPIQVGFSEWDVEPDEGQGVEITLPDGNTEVIGGLDDDVFSQHHNLKDVTGQTPSAGMIRTCACGFRWGPEEDIGEWKDRPLPKKRFFEHAERLKERLDEAGVDFDEESFDQFLDDKKSDPDEQFADDRIYADALGYASSVQTVRATS